MVKRGFLVALIAVIAVQMLSACGKTSGDGAGDGELKVAETKTVKKDPVELVIYFPFIADWSEEDFMKSFGEPLKRKYPHMTIKYIGGGPPGTKVPEILAAGQAIDIMFASIGATPGNLLDNALQYDITPLIKSHNYDLSTLNPSMVDMAKKLGNGAIYGLPVYVPPSAIYYNKDIFDKFGVPYPKAGLTWDDMFEMNKKLTRKDNETQYVGMGSSYNHMALMNQRTLSLVGTESKKPMFGNDDRWKQWGENLLRFYKTPGYEVYSKALSEPNERNRFFKDRVVAMFLALTALHQKSEINDMNWDIATFPSFADQPGVGPQPYPTYFYITLTSKHKDDAFDAIAYFASDEFQMERSKEGRFLTTSNNKAVRDAFGKDNPMYQGKNVKALQPDKYASPSDVNKYNTVAADDLTAAMKLVIQGTKDLNTALREAEETTTKKIQEKEAAASK
ncbi:ABC transporter substrate-binding protein [Paenibacillus sp. GYB004]|uniref:ABC transporter substrate-binding protein n=1 Tax=Paenibacillus sp. GYB004 TaxID=2994393 RepID=UPI002F96CF8C